MHPAPGAHQPTGWRTTPLPPDWPHLRAATLARDGNTCQRCGATATHADHTTPAHLGGPDTLDNLQALCKSCHDRKTGREAAAAKPLRTRPPPPHPGILP